jgi:hypothetical protein
VSRYLKPNGRKAQLRKPLSRAFLQKLIDDPSPFYLQSYIAGFQHAQRYSNLLHMATVPLSTAPQFERLAKLVGFPPDQIFASEAIESSVNVTREGRSEA